MLTSARVSTSNAFLSTIRAEAAVQKRRRSRSTIEAEARGRIKLHCRDDGGSSSLRPCSSWRAGMVCGILFEVHWRVHFNALSQMGRGVGERYYQVDQGSIIQLRYNGEKNLLCWKSKIEFEPKTAETSTCLYSFNSPQQGSLTWSYEACYPARFLSCPSGCFYGGNWSGLVFSSTCEMSSVAALF